MVVVVVLLCFPQEKLLKLIVCLDLKEKVEHDHVHPRNYSLNFANCFHNSMVLQILL